MRLHGAGNLAVDDAPGVDQLRRLEAGELGDPRHGAERAGGRRPEEAQGTARGNPQVRRNVDRDRQCHDQVAARDAAAALGERQDRGRRHRHGVHHRRLVDAVEFLVVDLEAVEQRRAGRRQAHAVGPRRRLVAVAPALHLLPEFGGERRARARDAGTERVEQEDLGFRDRTGREILVAGPDDVRGEPLRRQGRAQNTPACSKPAMSPSL